MIYGLLILVFGISLYVTYLYAQKRKEVEQFRENAEALKEVVAVQAELINQRERDIQDAEEILVQALVDDDNFDAVVDLFNELLSGPNDNGKLPN